MRQLSSIVANGATLTNTTVETILGQVALPAAYFQKAKAVRVSWAGTVPSTNSTDTLLIKARVGTLGTASDPAVFTGTATDATNSDVFGGDLQVLARADSAASVALIASGSATNPGAAPSRLQVASAAASAVNTSAVVYVTITGAWSVASASNQCALIALDAFEIQS